jgi:hypothetical protein
MHPFSVSDPCFHLKSQYPDAALLKVSLHDMQMHEKKGFIRLWLSEGIPFAFSNTPMLFEIIRVWLAKCLDIHPKMVTLVGSGRIGYSMDPKSFGQPFGDHSDLDFAIISEHLFISLSEEFQQWKKDFAEGVVVAKNYNQKRLWIENCERLPNNIARGFLDVKKIPWLYRYPTAKKIGNTLWKLHKKMEVTKIAPNVKASIRTYRDWEAFINQKLLSL